MHPNSGVFHYPIQLSDHAPIEFDTNLIISKIKRPYKLEAWCLTTKDGMDIITHSWRQHLNGSPCYIVTRKLSNTRMKLRKWCLDKKQEWQEKWSDFDKTLTSNLEQIANGVSHLDYDAHHSRLLTFSRAAAVYWRQRAKIKWSIDGDTCTKYFF